MSAHLRLDHSYTASSAAENTDLQPRGTFTRLRQPFAGSERKRCYSLHRHCGQLITMAVHRLTCSHSAQRCPAKKPCNLPALEVANYRRQTRVP